MCQALGRPPESHWTLMLLLSTAMCGAHAPVLALCHVDGRVPFRPSSAVLLTELTKLLLCAPLPLGGLASMAPGDPTLAPGSHVRTVNPAVRRQQQPW